MKKIIFLLILSVLLSCELEVDENQQFSSELMPISSVNIPSQFIFGQTHEITLNYTRPNDCYVFERIISQIDESNNRLIAVVDSNYFNNNCGDNPIEATVSFNFTATDNETYIFQFFQGTSDNGEDQYLIIEVPVVP